MAARRRIDGGIERRDDSNWTRHELLLTLLDCGHPHIASAIVRPRSMGHVDLRVTNLFQRLSQFSSRPHIAMRLKIDPVPLISIEHVPRDASLLRDRMEQPKDASGKVGRFQHYFSARTK